MEDFHADPCDRNERAGSTATKNITPSFFTDCQARNPNKIQQQKMDNKKNYTR